MDEEVNVTYITLVGLIDVHKYRFLYFMIISVIYALIICSNSIIVYLIWIHPNLHEPMYIFIAALLLNSVLFSSAIYPKLLMDSLSDTQIISYPACLGQAFIFYSLGGSEFLLLAAMAYDRYVSICKPLQYPSIMRKTTVCILLSLAWLVPVCHLAPSSAINARIKLCDFTLKVIFCNNSVFRLHCVSSRVLYIYGVFILLNVALLPMLFTLFTYAKIFQVSSRSCREVRNKAAETCLPHLLVLINLSSFCTCDVIIVRLESDFATTVQLLLTLPVVLCHPLLNPIIYGLKMKEISKHLKTLLRQDKMN